MNKIFTIILSFLAMSAFGQCNQPGYSCTVTYDSDNPAPAVIDLGNGGFVCFTSGEHNVTDIKLSANGSTNGLYVAEDAIVNFSSTANTNDYKANGTWIINGEVNYDAVFGDIFKVEGGPFYLGSTGAFVSNSVEFENAADNNSLGGCKVVINGAMTIREWDNHGPATINGSIELSSFDSHNKGSQPFTINCSMTINGDADILDQNIRGAGDLIVNGNLNVGNTTTNFVGDGTTQPDMLNIVYTTISNTNSNTFGVNTVQNGVLGQTTCLNVSIKVSGTIYNDTNDPLNPFTGDADGDLTGSNPLYVALVDDSGVVVDVITVDPASGDYEFSGVDDGIYTVVLTEDASVSSGDVSPTTTLTSFINNDESEDAVTDGENTITVLGADYVDVDFSVIASATISGVITLDADNTSDGGVNGSLINDGTGVTLLPLYAIVTDASGSVVASVPVNGDGSYSIDVTPNTPYSVILSETDYSSSIGMNPGAIDTDLSGYTNEAEESMNANDMTIDGEVAVTSGASNTDAPGNDFEIIALPPVNISGTVMVNETGSGDITGVSPDNASSSVPSLYATLIGPDGNVVNSILVDGATGGYNFSNVLPNADYIVMIGETNESGNIGSTPVAGTSIANFSNVAEGDTDGSSNSSSVSTVGDGTQNGSTPISLELTDNINVDFAIEEAVPATISGNVAYEGTSGDDTFGSGDIPMVGVVIELFETSADTDMNGTLDAGEIAAATSIAMTTTEDASGISGFYEFTGVLAGDYFIVQTQPPGFNNIGEGDQSSDGDFGEDFNTSGDNVIAVSVNGTDDEDNNFLEEPSTLVNINGSVRVRTQTTGNLEDWQSNPISETTYASLVSGGVVVATLEVPSNGDYTFNGVVGNTTYDIVVGVVPQSIGGELTPDAASTPEDYGNYAEGDKGSAGDGSPDGVLQVTVTNANIESWAGNKPTTHFIQTGKITGYVWNDVNGNTSFLNQTNNGPQGTTSDDVPLGGVTIELYASDGSTLLTSTTTGPDGSYEFTGLETSQSGIDYVVKQIQPSGIVSLGEEDNNEQYNPNNNNSDNEDPNPGSSTNDNSLDVRLVFSNSKAEFDVENNFFESGATIRLEGTLFSDDSGSETTYDGGSNDVPLSGIVVSLYPEDASNPGSPDFSATPLVSIPSSDGAYAFDVLEDASQNYIVLIEQASTNDGIEIVSPRYASSIPVSAAASSSGIDFPYDPTILSFNDWFGNSYSKEGIEASVFPNPVGASKVFWVSLLNIPNGEQIQISVFSITGQLLYQSGTFLSGDIRIDASSFSSNLLIVKIEGDTFSQAMKIIN